MLPDVTVRDPYGAFPQWPSTTHSSNPLIALAGTALHVY